MPRSGFDEGPGGLVAKLGDFSLSVGPMEHSRSELSQGGKGVAGTRLGVLLDGALLR